MKYKKFKKVLCCILALLTAITFASCGKNTYDINSEKYSGTTTFSELINVYNEVKTTTDILLGSPIDDNWKSILTDTENSVEALYYARENLDASALSAEDQALNTTFEKVLSDYKEGYETMTAAKDSIDTEIIRYAYNIFAEKVSEANNLWNEAVLSAAVTAAPTEVVAVQPQGNTQ